MKNKRKLAIAGLVLLFLISAGVLFRYGLPSSAESVVQDQLNMNLPDSKNSTEDKQDKLSLYEQAEKDSAKRREWMRNDPYLNMQKDSMLTSNLSTPFGEMSDRGFNGKLMGLSPNHESDPGDALLKKLEMLKEGISKPGGEGLVQNQPEPVQLDEPYTGKSRNNDLDRMQAMVNQVSKNDDEDPEMDRLSEMMDKILDIQHPQRVTMRNTPAKSAVYAVRSKSGSDTIRQGFFSWSEEQELPVRGGTGIESVVHGTQSLVNGSVICFRLLSPVFIKGEPLPTGTKICGIAELSGERLKVRVESIRSGQQIFPVRLELYDMDGIQGIYIPGAITRDVAKDGAERQLQMLQLESLDPSIKAQAASAGANVVKSLISKKAKSIRVTVKEGYRVFFKNNEL